MSGTSLDGLDMAYVHLWKEDANWCFELKAQRSISYHKTFRDELKKSVHLSGMDLMHLDVEAGRKFGNWGKEFISEEEIEVDYIASHGHTVFHQVDKGFTTQIANPHHIKAITGIPVIADFRFIDVVNGGQGAPLVPIGDHLLFSQYDFCLNLGGISNISFMRDGRRIAFDIGPANMLLNTIVAHLGLSYDDEGRIARSGSVIPLMLEEFNGLDYYAQQIPKSLGFEWFEERVVPIIDKYAMSHAYEDMLCTSVQHIAIQVLDHINRFAEQKSGTLMVSGGGALNVYLMDVLREQLLPNIELIIPDSDIIEYKEAIVFALMGAMKVVGECNILSSVTGADKDSIAGIIY